MTLLQTFLLGLLQGTTQFLPVSASGHLILVPWFLRWQDPPLAIRVFLTSGGVFALFLCFGKEWWNIIGGGISSIIERKIGFDRDRSLFWLMVAAIVPNIFAGLLFHDFVQAELQAPLIVAMSLCAVGFLLYGVEGRHAALRTLEEVRMKNALLIGTACAAGMVPGISRLAISYIMARLLGLGRENSVRFILLLLLPVSLGVALYQWWELTLQPGIVIPVSQLLLGFAAAAISGVVAIQIVVSLARHSSLTLFVWYRMALATVVVCWSLFFRV